MKARLVNSIRIILIALVGIVPLVFSGSSVMADAGTFTSDNFNSCQLKPMWGAFIDPHGDGSFAIDGKTVSISVPQNGNDHDIWVNGSGGLNIFAPRFMQTATNTPNFTLEVKMNSGVAGKFQKQGILIQQDDSTILRFEFFGDGTNTWVFAAKFFPVSGVVLKSVYTQQSIGNTGISPLYMKIQRSGTVTWTQSYSTNGTQWTVATGSPFNFNMGVNKIGFYGGNALATAGGTAPAHTAIFDYVSNADAPATPDQTIDCSVKQTQAIFLPLILR